MKITAVTGILLSLSALAAMAIGHMGAHELHWMRDQISTFAARAPMGQWVTTSMLLSSAALVCAGLLISRHGILGNGRLPHLAPLLAGAAAAGLLMLAFFQEKASGMTALRSAGLAEVREQTFHDAGLMIFFYSSISLCLLSGLCCALFRKGTPARVTGIIVALMGPASYYLMTSAWESLMGIPGSAVGLRQRASLLALWLAIILLQALAFGDTHSGNSAGQEKPSA